MTDKTGPLEYLVLSFGFMNGIWIAIGMNPESMIVGVLINLIKAFNPEYAGQFGFLFWLIGIVAIIGNIALAFSIAEWIGILALSLGFISGALIIITPTLGAFLLIASIFLAKFIDG